MAAPTAPKPPEPPVDFRTALGWAQTLERTYGQAVQVLRAAVEIEGGRAARERQYADLTQKSEALERELPALEARAAQARAATAAAEQAARDAHATEAEKHRQAVADATMRLAEVTQAGEAKARELEATYQARRTQLEQETREAEAKLQQINEAIAAIVARHAR